MKTLITLILGTCSLFCGCNQLTNFGTNPNYQDVFRVMPQRGSPHGRPGPANNQVNPSAPLNVHMDKGDAEVVKLPYQLAGSTTTLLAAITFQSDDSVSVDSFTVFVNTVSAARTFGKLMIVDGDKITVLSENYNVQPTTTLKNVGRSKKIYLVATLNKIGKDQVGLIDATADFQIGKVAARYLGNQKPITEIIYESDPTLDRTAPSPKMEVVAARISNVSLVASGSGMAVSSSLNVGWCNVAIIKMTAAASANSEPNGNLARIILDKIRLNIQKNPGLIISQVQIGRIQSSGINLISIPYPDNTELDMSVASDADRAIDPASSAYFLVKVKIESLNPNIQDFLEVSLNNLDGDASTANFTWRDGIEAAQKSALRLPVSILAGTKIVE